MKKIQSLGTIYFLTFLGTLLLDFIAFLNINPLLTSILSFISTMIKSPKNVIDLILLYTELGNAVLIISGICFFKTINEFMTTGEISMSY